MRKHILSPRDQDLIKTLKLSDWICLKFVLITETSVDTGSDNASI